MVFVRGHRKDYDSWAAGGVKEWAFADVLPYFMRMETAHGGQTGWRGKEGPLHVTHGRCANPLYNAFIAAGVEAGFWQNGGTTTAKSRKGFVNCNKPFGVASAGQPLALICDRH